MTIVSLEWKMSEREPSSVACPFCGAPQRRFIPYDAIQAKCHYCGGVFLVHPEREDFKYRCLNHPDRVPVGLCNDCGQSFCRDCLHTYEIKVQGEDAAVLHLCPNCLAGRYINKAYRSTGGGLLFLLIGILIIAFLSHVNTISLFFGLLMILFGLAAIIYANWEKNRKLEELEFYTTPIEDLSITTWKTRKD